MYYGVVRGRLPGIYETQAECNDQVEGFPGAIFKQFKTYAEAKQFCNSFADCASELHAASRRARTSAGDESFSSADTSFASTTSNSGAITSNYNERKRLRNQQNPNYPPKRRRPKARIKQEYVKCFFSGTTVFLPPGVELYACQKLIIVKMLEAFKGVDANSGRGNNALIESPTGSGKTLALLAASCAFLLKHREERKVQRAKCPKHGSGGGGGKEGKERKAKNAREKEGGKGKGRKRKSAGGEEGTKQDPVVLDDDDGEEEEVGRAGGDEDVEGEQEDESTISMEASANASSIYDTLTLTQHLGRADEDNYYEDDEEAVECGSVDGKGSSDKKCTCGPRMRIYYGTRTHKQISQVVQEFRRLPYGEWSQLRHTIMASREQSCINEGIRNPSLSGAADADNNNARKKSITARCKDLLNDKKNCEYKLNLREYDSGEGRQKLREKVELDEKVWDLEDLVNSLKGDQFGHNFPCPYFASTRVLTVDADIIFTPFNYLLDPIIRQSSDVHLKGSIVILDEAHNVEDICREAASFGFLSLDLDFSLQLLREKKKQLDEFRQLMVGANFLDLQQNMAVKSAKVLDDVEIILDGGEEAANPPNPQEDGEGSRLRATLNEFSENIQTVIQFLCDFKDLMDDFVGEAEASTRGAEEFSHTFEWEKLFEMLQGREGTLLFGPKSARFAELSKAIQTFTGPGSRSQPAADSSADSRFPSSNNSTESTNIDKFRPSIASLGILEKFLCFAHYFHEEENRQFYKCNVKRERHCNHAIGFSTQMLESTVRHHTQHSNARRGGLHVLANAALNEPHPAPAIPLPYYGDGDEEDNQNWMSSQRAPAKLSDMQQPPKYVITLSFWCMFPSVACMDAFRDTHSVILASGTLCPAETLKTELGVQFAVEMEGKQVIGKERIFASVIAEGPTGHKLQATFKNISSSDSLFIRELARVVISTCMHIPRGVLCFVSSYMVLNQLHEAIRKSSDWRELSDRKEIFLEPKKSSELSQLLENYERAIEQPAIVGHAGRRRDGALMLAVFRGKVSEGIDFTDNKARCVICVGIPFPSIKDELVQQKKRFNDANCQTMRILTGDEWYKIQAYRALNQALGRCLRHRMDWGALLLVDERFLLRANGTDAKKISKWVRERMCTFASHAELCKALTEFAQKMGGEAKENVAAATEFREPPPLRKPFRTPILFK